MRQMKRGHQEEDEFRKLMNKFIKLIVHHRETSIIAAIVVIGIITLLLYRLSSGEQQRPEADLIHTQTIGLITMGRFQEAENLLQDLTQRFENTRPGKIGFYYLGMIYYHSARFEEALTNFEKFVKLQKNDYLLIPSALFGAGCCAEALKDYERALGYYEKIIKNKESPFYYLGMLAYGGITGLLGDKEKAREILKGLIEQNPSRDIESDARYYIGYFNE